MEITVLVLLILLHLGIILTVLPKINWREFDFFLMVFKKPSMTFREMCMD